nr:hypothetical protein [uncultured Flavobacterium sp.]
MEQKIKCPECGTGEILFDTKQMLSGVQFSCTHCQATIGIAQESRAVVHDTMEKLESVKRLSAQQS